MPQGPARVYSIDPWCLIPREDILGTLSKRPHIILKICRKVYKGKIDIYSEKQTQRLLIRIAQLKEHFSKEIANKEFISHRRKVPPGAFNMGRVMTWKDKVSKALKGRVNNRKGAKNSPEHIRKVAEANRGKKRTKAARKRISIAGKKRFDRIGRNTPEENLAMRKANGAIGRARRRRATCPHADRKLMRLIYANCPPGYHVDHIIPISRGGLHHENNLQYLPKSENLRKHNKINYQSPNAIQWQSIIKVPTN